MKVQGKILVVTGGAKGMGRELVLTLLSRGAAVAAVDVDAAALALLVEAAGERASRLSTHVVDITDRAAVEALPQAVIAHHGAVDGVVNNAGVIQPFVRLNDLGYDAIDRLMAINWRGTLQVTKTFLPHLLARPEAHVTNVSSMGGFLPVPGQTVYGASKAAVKLLSEGLHAELAGTTVGVMVVFPGAMNTNIAANSGVAMHTGSEQSAIPMTPPTKAAEQIVDGIERGTFRLFVGRDARVMDALYRLAPERAAAFIAKQMAALLG